MSYDLRRGPPLDLRTRRLIAAVVAWCCALGALLLVSALGPPPGSTANVVGALFSAGGLLAALVLLLLGRATPRPRDQPGAVLEDDESLVLVTDLGVDPLGPGIAVYLLGMVFFAAASVRFVNRAHVADGILISAIGHALLSSLAARAFGPTLARVNSAGVTIARGGRARTFSWSDLREVGLHRGDLELILLDGRRVLLRASKLAPEDQRMLRSRIEARIAAASGPLPDGSELLARAGRSLKEWRRALSHLVIDEGYRERGLTFEQAEAVLEARRAPAEERIGAAFALAASGTPRAGECIRSAAAACPDRRLRAALLEASAEDPREAVLGRALPRTGRS